MYNKIIKLIIAVGIFAYAIYQFTESYIGNGIMLILLSSILGQYFLYFAFTNFLEVGNTVNENLVDRLYNLNDTSNMARVSAAFYGLNYFFKQDYFNILFGAPSLLTDITASGFVIPHNWFIQSLYILGLPFTALIVFCMIKIIYEAPRELLPYVGMIMIMSAILSLVVVPITLFFVSIFILNRDC